jgi:hypothetical protein
MAGKQQIDIGQLPIQQLNALTQQFQEVIYQVSRVVTHTLSRNIL